MAAIWKGHISFGLVSIPISLHTAETKDELKFNLLDKRDGSRVRNRRVNEATGEEVPWSDIVKAYEMEKDRYVVLEKEDFERAKGGSARSIEIERFVDEGEIQFAYFEKPYYVVPGKKAEKGYVILREALKGLKKIGIARVVLGSREHVAALIPAGNSLMLELLRYGEELRDMSEFSFPGGNLEAFKISEKEIELARLLVENLSGGWDPDAYHDEYREALLHVIKRKVEGGAVAPPAPERAEESGRVIDIMELLKKSVEQSSGKGRKPARRKASAKKRPTKKAVGE